MPEQTFLLRYLAGDRINVWQELQALGEIVEPWIQIADRRDRKRYR